MKNQTELPEDISRRIDQLAARSTLTRGQIIEDALSHGRSLAWQERWVAGVQAGIEDADRGNFASEEEITAVLNKFGQA
jgi:predicted transcriptional regulator